MRQSDSLDGAYWKINKHRNQRSKNARIQPRLLPSSTLKPKPRSPSKPLTALQKMKAKEKREFLKSIQKTKTEEILKKQKEKNG